MVCVTHYTYITTRSNRFFFGLFLLLLFLIFFFFFSVQDWIFLCLFGELGEGIERKREIVNWV